MSKPSRTTNPSSFQFNNRGRLNGSWLMQWKLMDAIKVFTFFFPLSSWKQFFTSSWHWATPLPWNLMAKFHMGLPWQWILTAHTQGFENSILMFLPPRVQALRVGIFISSGLVMWNFILKLLPDLHWLQALDKKFLGKHAWSRLQLKLMQEAGWLPFTLTAFQMGLQCIMINISL